MLNPITNNRKNIILYSLVWVAIMAAHFFLIALAGDISIFIKILDSIVQISFLYALGIGIWHITAASKNEKAFAAERWAGIFLSGMMIVVVWQISSGGLVWLITEKSDIYRSLFMEVLPYRLMFGFFVFIILTIIYHNIIVFRDFSERKIKEEKLRSNIAEQELNMLWSQINPHFLFNSLNSISALTMSDPEAAYDMTIKLSDFLRFSINTRDKQLHTLEEELEVCDRYMDIERTRFGNRIKYTKSVCENCGTVMVPRLIIQPLLENALKHGAYETSKECEITLKCKINANLLIINLENSFDPTAVQPKKGRGVGLENIKKRLQLLYPRDGILATEKQQQLFLVTLQIPVS